MVLPSRISRAGTTLPHVSDIRTQDKFIDSISEAISRAPMAIRLTPHILSVIDWSNPIDDPVRRQFIPLGNELIPDHHRLKLDSLNEEHDSPVKGLVHRYPTKALFLGKLLLIEVYWNRSNINKKLPQFAMSIAVFVPARMRLERTLPL